MDLQLENKVVLITGGGKGIGAAIARGCAREGAIPVQEITGLKLDTYRDRLMAQVAIEIVAATEGGVDVLHAPERLAR